MRIFAWTPLLCRHLSARGDGNGRYLFASARRPVRSYVRARVGIQAPGKDVMNVMYWFAVPLVLGLLAYLLYALLRAERF
jgi:K+-transporting ATPase KdpF subunit